MREFLPDEAIAALAAAKLLNPPPAPPQPNRATRRRRQSGRGGKSWRLHFPDGRVVVEALTVTAAANGLAGVRAAREWIEALVDVGDLERRPDGGYDVRRRRQRGYLPPGYRWRDARPGFRSVERIPVMVDEVAPVTAEQFDRWAELARDHVPPDQLGHSRRSLHAFPPAYDDETGHHELPAPPPRSPDGP